MSEDKKPTVDEHIDVILIEGESLEREEFLDKVNDMYNKNMHKAFDKYAVKLIRTKEFGWTLFFDGTRDETKDETAIREADEKVRRKTVEAAELKEYLRLKKKYGKKDK